MARAGIVGLGVSLPPKVITNDDLSRMVDTSDEWIRERTGIRERRVVEPGVAASDLALEAAEGALRAASISPAEVELIIVATVTPDMPWPSTACFLQDRLGARGAAAFDLEAACTGFVYALAIGRQFIETGTYRTVLVVGVETLSKIVDWTDRTTCVLFGDGAGAAVLRPVDGGAGILGTYLGADGSGATAIAQPGGGSRHPMSRQMIEENLHVIHMNGREVYKFAVRAMGDAAERVLRDSGYRLDQVDFFVPHQANLRIIEASARRLGLPMEKVFINLHKYGNISAASIPVCLYEAVAEGRLRPGDLALLVAFGGGLTWGSALIRWGEAALG